MIVTLIGSRATGKTTVGAALAARLQWPFHDLDPLIEETVGLSIADMFSRHGESYFRAAEQAALLTALAHGPAVVSPGGGIVLNEENCAAIAAAGPVVWLQADVETIVQRLSADPLTQARRPSLTGQDVTSEVRDVLLARWSLYERVATQVVKTENRTPASIVDEIVAGLPVGGV